MKALVLYYSNTGSNRYLADRIARALGCDSEGIRPRLGAFPLQVLFSLTGAGPGVRALRHDPKGYDVVVLCGPIWMGKLVAPLRDTLRRYRSAIERLYFATCCGSCDAQRDGRFGYARVFPQVKRLVGEKCIHCEAFPIGLVIPEEKQGDDNAVMKTRLSDDNFTGAIQERLDAFVEKVKGR